MKRVAKKVYVGCALTDASEEFKQSVEDLKQNLRAEGHEVFDFVGLTKGTPEDVYRWDIGHCVKNCDAFIGICDFPSLGLGYEIAEAVNLKKPILTLAHQDSKVTRLIIGAAEAVPNFSFKRYKNLEELLPLALRWLDGL